MSNKIMHFSQMKWIYTHGHTADYHQDIRYFLSFTSFLVHHLKGGIFHWMTALCAKA